MIVPEKRDRKMALVVIDLQNKFFGDNEKLAKSKELHIDTIKETIRAFREAKRPVIFITFDGFAHGSDYNSPEGDSIISDVKVEPTDLMVGKYHMNSFRNTNLADVVKSTGCDTVLLIGMLAQYCVSATYWGASDHGISAFMMEGGLITTDEELNELIFKLYRTYTMEEVEENLRTTVVEPPKGDTLCQGSH